MQSQWLNLPWIKTQNDKIAWGNLAGSALSLAISDAVKSHAGFKLIVTQNTQQALKLEAELNYYCLISQLTYFQTGKPCLTTIFRRTKI